jgi:2-oxoglutarate ferredoxin oxidoreductase subunit alpha
MSVIEDNSEKTISWRMAGAAGQGIVNIGLILAKTCLKEGFHVFANSENPSLIRGGHNFLTVRISNREIKSHEKFVDILVPLNQESVEKHIGNMKKGGCVIYDDKKIKIDDNAKRDDVVYFSIPLEEFAKKCGGLIFENMVAMGATIAIMDLDYEALANMVKDVFSKKGETIVKNNLDAAKLGYDYAKENFGDNERFKLSGSGKTSENRVLISGNQSVAGGAIKAGCKFMSAYPMTPATTIMETIASQERNYNIVMKQTEDEIAAINMAIGASFCGARAMTATSGGGFALMVEGFGLAAMTETPLVVVVSQRPGPATGMATRSGQGDLKFALNAAPDDFPHVVLAPGDIEDCFYKTIEAFQITEKYQTPVIILIDKFLSLSYKSTRFETSGITVKRESMLSEDEIPDNYKRYKITPNGISPRTIPGQKGGMFTASSYEHNEEGHEDEDGNNRIRMAEKRFRKFKELSKEIKPPELIGPDDADITLLCWGSTKGAVEEAVRILNKEGIKVNFMHYVFISPFPEEKTKDVINKAKKVAVVENNQTGQLASIIKEKTGMDVGYKILKFNGRPFFPEEIVEEVKKIVGR